MLSAARLRRILPTLPLVPVRGPWYRTVNFDHLGGPPPGAPGTAPLPLWPGGAARQGARFTPRAAVSAAGAPTGGIDTLYLAEDELTPLAEIAGVLRPPGSPIKLVFAPQVLMTVDGPLTDILDLTDPAVQNSVGTTHQELTGAWVLAQSLYLAGAGPMPPTQLLGQEAFASGQIVGLRYPSSKNPSGIGLVVFTARLVSNRHRLTVFNHPGGRLQQSLP